MSFFPFSFSFSTFFSRDILWFGKGLKLIFRRSQITVSRDFEVRGFDQI